MLKFSLFSWERKKKDQIRPPQITIEGAHALAQFTRYSRRGFLVIAAEYHFRVSCLTLPSDSIPPAALAVLCSQVPYTSALLWQMTQEHLEALAKCNIQATNSFSIDHYNGVLLPA